MKNEMTYGQLIALDNDINYQCSQSISYNYFNRDKIIAFYNFNKIPLQVAKQRHNELLKEHIELDEKGNLKTIDKEDGSKEYVWKKPSSKEEFDKQSKEFLSRSISIRL
jgi:hypothetical protein